MERQSSTEKEKEVEQLSFMEKQVDDRHTHLLTLVLAYTR